MNLNISLGTLRNYFAVRSFRKTRESFYDDLADAIKDSEPMVKFISIRKTRSIKQRDPISILYANWIKRMDKEGGKLSYVLKGAAPEGDILVLAAIEDKGDLADGLRFLASTIKDQRGMKEAMIAGIIMPAIVSLIMIIFMVVLSVYVIPVFADIAPVKKWNGIGQILYGMSYTVTHYGILLLILAGSLGFWFVWSLSNWTGLRRAVIDRYLPYSVYRDYNGAIFLVSLAVMMHSGDTLVRSLETLKKRGSPWLRWHITRILKNLDKTAGNYGEAFATGIFSQHLTNRIVDYSRRSSEFDKVISRIGIEGIAKVRKEVESSAKLLNMILITVLGALLAFMLVGTILTAQGLSTSLKEEVNMQKFGR